MDPSFNPYAPPTAELESHRRFGEAFRDGKLIAIRDDDNLPPRCVVCGRAAPDLRISRTLFWIPSELRWGMLAIIVLLLVLATTGDQVSMLAFWPAVFIAAIVNMILRRKFRIEFPVCERHHRLHQVFTWTAGLSIPAVVAASALLISNNMTLPILFLLPAMLVLGLIRGRSGIMAIRVARVKDERLWLKGTGKAFREGLPQLGQTAQDAPTTSAPPEAARSSSP